MLRATSVASVDFEEKGQWLQALTANLSSNCKLQVKQMHKIKIKSDFPSNTAVNIDDNYKLSH
jgi:hypothetical protein